MVKFRWKRQQSYSVAFRRGATFNATLLSFAIRYIVQVVPVFHPLGGGGEAKVGCYLLHLDPRVYCLWNFTSGISKTVDISDIVWEKNDEIDAKFSVAMLSIPRIGKLPLHRVLNSVMSRADTGFSLRPLGASITRKPVPYPADASDRKEAGEPYQSSGGRSGRLSEVRSP